MNIDYELLTKQRDFLLSYPWRDGFPEEADGIINLLDTLLDQGYTYDDTDKKDN